MAGNSIEHWKLAAIMFTDLVGFSAISQKNETLALKMLERHRQIIREHLPQFAGREIQTIGDGFLIEFESAVEATRCGVQIQRALAEINHQAVIGQEIQVRIGIHVGDVIHCNGDILGDGVNIAARIEPLAEPGGICVSQHVYDQIRNKIDLPMLALGAVDLKNIAEPIPLYRISLGEASPGIAPNVKKNIQEFSVAVLPFINLSAESENEYLNDGITEELISELSRVKGLRVPARTSVFVFKGRNEDVRSIARKLGVSKLLEGSVRKTGIHLRITAQLIDGADGYQLWSDRYDRELSDIFDIQEQIANAIVTALKVQLSDREGRINGSGTASVAAYQFYLQGRYQWNKRGIGLRKAVHFFELAILEDSKYALAYTGLADAYNLLGFYSYLPSRTTVELARNAATKAIDEDDSLSEAYAALGLCLLFDWQWVPAEDALLNAIERNPNYFPGQFYYATYLSAMGRFEEAVQHDEEAIRIDPLSAFARTHLGWTLIFARQYDWAVEELRRALAMDPKFFLTHSYLGQALIAKGENDEGLSRLHKAVELSGGNNWMRATLLCCLARTGRCSEASNMLALLEKDSSEVLQRLDLVAAAKAALGDIDVGFTLLDEACEARCATLLWANSYFLFDHMRSDIRFDQLLAKMNFV